MHVSKNVTQNDQDGKNHKIHLRWLEVILQMCQGGLEKVDNELLLPWPEHVHWNCAALQEQPSEKKILAILMEMLLSVVGKEQKWVICGLHSYHLRMETYDRSSTRL